MINIFLFGPFLGDFKSEVLTFRPFYYWFKNNNQDKKIYVSSHFNRKFLYSNNDTFIEYDYELSINEANQKNYYNLLIDKRKYLRLSTELKEKISTKENILPKQLKQLNLSYIQTSQQYSSEYKLYNKINIIDDILLKDTIIYIADNSIDELTHQYIYKELKQKFNIIVIGDKNTYLQEYNIFNNIEFYSTKIYYQLVKYISSCKCVITPSSYWTYICNLQQTPVISWGENVSQYKFGEALNFGNKNSIINSNDTDKIIKQIDWFLSRL